VLEKRAGDADAGVVDEYVDRALLGFDSLRHGHDRVVDTEVAGVRRAGGAETRARPGHCDAGPGDLHWHAAPFGGS
jgi:hypothetical protein